MNFLPFSSLMAARNPGSRAWLMRICIKTLNAGIKSSFSSGLKYHRNRESSLQHILFNTGIFFFFNLYDLDLNKTDSKYKSQPKLSNTSYFNVCFEYGGTKGGSKIESPHRTWLQFGKKQKYFYPVIWWLLDHIRTVGVSWVCFSHQSVGGFGLNSSSTSTCSCCPLPW